MRLPRILHSLAIGLAAVLVPTAAAATEASATTALNVRSGPSTSFIVVDTLTPGEVVEVTECEPGGWCFIQHPGPDGWVSSNYLTATPSAGSAGPDCSFRLTLGPDGPEFTLVCGDDPGPSPGPGPVPAATRACFYDLPNYNGQNFCRTVGLYNSLPPIANDRITSVRLFGGAKVRLCANVNLGGYCRQVNNNVPLLGALINNRTSSLRVFTGALPPPPPPTPVTHSTGSVDLLQTATLNLDNGVIAGAGTDIWHQAVTATQKFITPRNGARLARGDGSNRGFSGCSVASFSTDSIPIAALPVGTYVCARTDQGRISQFRVNAYIGTTMRLGYTTWAN